MSKISKAMFVGLMSATLLAAPAIAEIQLAQAGGGRDGGGGGGGRGGGGGAPGGGGSLRGGGGGGGGGVSVPRSAPSSNPKAFTGGNRDGGPRIGRGDGDRPRISRPNLDRPRGDRPYVGRPHVDRRTNHDGGHRRWHRGTRYLWGGLPFYFYNGYYYGDCGWLRRRAEETGSRYWWIRYRQCREGD